MSKFSLGDIFAGKEETKNDDSFFSTFKNPLSKEQSSGNILPTFTKEPSIAEKLNPANLVPGFQEVNNYDYNCIAFKILFRNQHVRNAVQS